MLEDQLMKKMSVAVFGGILILSGLFLGGMIFTFGSAQNPGFGSVNYGGLETGASGFWFSINISDAESAYLNFTVKRLGGESQHYHNWSITNSTPEGGGKSWFIRVDKNIPNDGVSVDYNVSAINNTGDWAAKPNATINIKDSITPTVVGKCYTAADPTPKDDITIIEDTEVFFNASGTTDNIGVDGYKWWLEGTPIGTDETTSHIFKKSGEFDVKLNVTDAAGNYNTDTITVTVQELPTLSSDIDTYIGNVSELDEDSDFTNISLEDNGTGVNYIFNYSGAGITFKVRGTDGSWGTEYNSDNLTGEIFALGGIITFQIKPKADIYFPEDVVENVTLNASTSGGFLEYTVPFKVLSVNDEPEITTPAPNATVAISEGMNQTITVVAKDPRDPEDALTLETNISEALGVEPTAMNTTIDNTTNKYTFKFNLTPTNDMVGQYPISLKVSDDDAASEDPEPFTVYNNITLQIDNTNDIPAFETFEIDDEEGDVEEGVVKFTIKEDEETTVKITASDPDLIHGAEVLEFDIEESENLSVEEIEKIDNTTANLTVKGNANLNTNAWVNVSLIDEFGDAVYQVIEFTLEPTNDAPDINKLGIKVTKKMLDKVLQQYNFRINYTTNNSLVDPGSIKDIDGDVLTFNWFIISDPNGTAEPDWSKEPVAKGTNITYQFPAVGNYTIWLNVTDGKGGYSFDKFSVDGDEQIVIEAPKPEGAGGEESSLALILIIVVVVVLIVAGVVVFLIIKKKGGDETVEDEFADLGMPPGQPPQPGMEQQQFPGQPPQPGMEQQQFPGQPPQPGMEQQQFPGQPPQPGMEQQQFPGQPPQPGMEQQQFPGQPPQPGMEQQQFPGQPQQPGMEQQQFPGQPQQPGMEQQQFPGQPQQPGMEQQQFPGQPQQPGMEQQFPGQPQQPGMDQQQFPGQPQQPGMGQQPGLAPQQPGMQQAAPQGGNQCPHCGSPVEPSWFLCPNCKNQL